MESRDFEAQAANVAMGGALRLEGVQRPDAGEPAAFVLERFSVFTDDARIIVHGPAGETILPAPANTYFRGFVDGEPDSRVFLAARPGRGSRGLVASQGEVWMIGGEGTDGELKSLTDGELTMRRVDPSQLKAAQRGFTCGNEQLPQIEQAVPPLPNLAGDEGTVPQASDVPAALPLFGARVAIETDYEFYQIFGNTAEATDYAADLIGFISTFYVAEIDTALTVQSVSLWTTNGDPWTQTSSFCGLMQFGQYWNANRTNVSRTIAHFLSGKGTGGGVAWVGVLCRGGFSYSATCPGMPSSGAYGGGYGFTGNISGGFDVNNPGVLWDTYATAHEIGHNFDSPHTHCYNNPVDQCYSGECANGCHCGTQSLPGPIGTRSGTIMSYCHLNGGYQSIAMSFGTNHPYGLDPGRVATRMRNHVVGTAASNPTCLAPPLNLQTLLTDGFETGTTGAWNSQ
jgi:hypothetical protein